MNAYWKDVFREISNTKGRFIMLMIISALGAASIVGLQATAIDMRAIADKTYKERNLYDIQLKSTVGFNEDDINILRNVDGVKTVMPSFVFDVYAYVNGNAFSVRTYSLPTQLNQIKLLEGRFPENAGECLVEPRFLNAGNYQLGDKIFLGLDNIKDFHNAIEGTEFTITGIGMSPKYISVKERGLTNLGNGRMDFYIYLHSSAYVLDVYTDIYIQMQDSASMDNLSDAYNNAAVKWRESFKPIGNARIPVKLEDLENARQKLDDGFREYYDGIKELEERLAEGKIELEKAETELNNVNLEKEFEQGTAQLNEAKIKLDDAKKQLEESQETLNANRRMLREARFNAYQAEIDSGWNTYYGGLEEYEKGVAEFEREKEAAYKKISDARREIEKGKAEYEREKAAAYKKLNDAFLELEDAKEKLENALEPEWFYFTRKDGVAFETYYQDTIRLGKIGYIVPLVFLLVAILVSLTTMTRMVEEHRTQMGIYKALGYRGIRIMNKYLIYAAFVGIIGGAIGVCAGSYFFPVIISSAYSHMYDMPPVETPIPYFIGTVSVAATVITVALATFLTCVRTTRDVPAILMRPKPPRAGKRVLLEYIPFVWKRFGFIGKVTARNIFRYKRRFFMSFIGVAACTALLVTAFGLRDSVSGVVDIQFEQILKFDAMVYFKDIKTDQQRDELDSILNGAEQSSQYLYIREESVNVKGLSASVIVPENPEQISEFIDLVFPENTDSVIITGKIAKLIDASKDKRITITAEGQDYIVNVAGVTENYILNYVYMPPDLYTEVFGEPPAINGAYIRSENLSELSRTLLSNGNVRAFIHKSDYEASAHETTDALGILTILLIVLACALALVVLFNLTNINISERIRELATIKVLGFYDSEISLYVNRENIVVTLIGIFLGLWGGRALLGFLLGSIEVDMFMFPVIIYPLSFLSAALLSTGFSLFVNIVMNTRLNSIDMVGSLKNVE